MFASNPALEAAITRDPDALEPRLVYADWLEERGDPRGELAVVQHALAQGPNPALEKRQRQLAGEVGAKIREHLFGAPDAVGVTLQFRLGLLDSVDLMVWGGVENDQRTREWLVRLFALEPKGALRKLSLVRSIYQRPLPYVADFGHVVRAIVDAKPHHLRFLSMLEGDRPFGNLGDLRRLYPVLPSLETLHVSCGMAELGPMRLRSLRELALCVGNLGAPANLRSVMSPRWETLTALALDLQTGGLTLRELQPLFLGKNFPSLAHLALRNAPFGRDLVNAIADGFLLRQLRSLDLTQGSFDASSIDALIARRDRFRHLDVILVDANVLAARSDPAFESLRRVVTLRSPAP